MRFAPEPTPAAILKAIRDGKASTLDELADYFLSADFPDREMNKMAFRSIYGRLIDRLVEAGLLEGTPREKFAVAASLDLVLSALNLSLTELSRRDSDSMLVYPIFGPPPRPYPRTDLFVLMPFADALRPVYEDHIRSVAKRCRLKVTRADDFFATEAIVRDIWKAICICKVVIADCTGRNPNVFYEIGIAHTVGRPTILIAQDMDDVPFDLRHLRCIKYDYTPRGMVAFEEVLEKTLETELAKLDAT